MRVRHAATTLPSATTIWIDPYNTELEVDASQGGTFVVTINVWQILATAVPVSNHNRRLVPPST